MNKAIELARSVGYKTYTESATHSSEMTHSDILLDPKFFQALGKACGWLEKETKKEWFSGLHGVSIPEWRYRWHRFIDHLAEGKDAESFFNELLK